MEGGDRRLQRVAPDEPHGIVGPAIAVGPQAVDRHDARVLEPAGDLGFEQEPLAAGRVVGMMVEDLLERDLAVQLGVEGHENRTQASAGVRPQDAKPQAVGRRRAHGVGGGAVDVVPGPVRGRSEMAKRRLDVDVGQSSQALARRAAGVDGRQALFHVTSMPFEVPRRQGLDGGAVIVVEVTAYGQMVGQTQRPFERPGPERGQKLILVDDPILEREQSKEEMAVGGHGMVLA